MTSNGRLAGRLVLVMENDYFLADDERSLLESEGATVLGPFSHGAEAIEAADRARPNCALVDINLGGGLDFVPARKLAARGIPIVFVTGYEPDVLPAEFAKAPYLQKPFADRNLIELAASVLKGGCAP